MVTVSPDARGFTVASSPPIRVDWDRVDRIVAYKVDLFSYDMICLAFSVSPDGREVEITEEDRGWRAVLDALDTRFGLKDDWWSSVAFPAFQPNRTVVWQRADGKSDNAPAERP